ncbi:hypothetical protein NDU88_010675 [Pleurodeles waltl]|uniref:Uncharacterized protein n=1 Tax=Pleurodeles waltl TaxID=8319 RepID=A0AAV7QVD5_PLEWA|nr:hypothetical protein NDU88_010675 [Pleurodeles waltl]
MAPGPSGDRLGVPSAGNGPFFAFSPPRRSAPRDLSSNREWTEVAPRRRRGPPWNSPPIGGQREGHLTGDVEHTHSTSCAPPDLRAWGLTGGVGRFPPPHNCRRSHSAISHHSSGLPRTVNKKAPQKRRHILEEA